MANLQCEWLERKIFHSSGIEYIPKKLYIGKKNITPNIYKIHEGKLEVC